MNLIDILLPKRCIFCRNICDEYLCAECKSLAENKRDGDIYSAFKYKGNVRLSIQRFKFSNCSYYAEILAPYMLSCLKEMNAGNFDVITWVPSSFMRFYKRGYCQSKVLAEELSKNIGLPCKPLLMKIRDVKSQTNQLDDIERRKNVKGVFKCTENLNCRRVLLVDDVVTTGSTLLECIEILKKAGASSASCICTARARNKMVEKFPK